MGIIQKIRQDGWFSLISKIGVVGADKRMSSQIEWNRMTEVHADNLYAADDILGKIVDIVPEESFREGYKLVGENTDPIKDQAKKLHVDQKIVEAWKKGRQYGGAAILYITGATDLAQPLGMNEEIKGLVTLSRWELYTEGSEIDSDINSPTFGYPLYYRLQVALPQVTQNSVVIHHSRVERFDGNILPRRLFIGNNYWHDSIMNKIENAVRNYQTSHDAAATMTVDFNVGIYKMKNLAELISQPGGEDQIRSRIELANYSKSVIRALILDESEDYKDQAKSVAGLPELLKIAAERLVSATSIPHTVLLGESPTGSNATGNSTVLGWYDYIASQQDSYLKPKHTSILQKISLRTDFEIDYNPLWQMDEKELTNIRQLQSQIDAAYISNGVLDPEEVAVSRFGGEKYSTDTHLSRTVNPVA